MSERLKVHAALFTVSVFFGAFHVIGKAALQEIPPFFLITVRVIAAAILLQLLLSLRGREHFRSSRDMFKVAFYSFFGIGLNQLFFIKGLELSTAINASILITVIPVLTFAFALLSGQEKPGFLKLSGMAMAFGGIFWFVGGWRLDLSGEYALGNIFLIINSTAYAYYLVSMHGILKRYGSLTVTAWAFTFGILYISPFGIQEGLSLDYAAVPAWAWAALGYIILFASVFTYLINNWSLKRSSPTLVAVYIYVQPVTAYALATLFLGETLSPDRFYAAVLIFTGVFLTSRARQQIPA